MRMRARVNKHLPKTGKEVKHHPPSTFHCPLSTVFYLLSTVHCPMSTVQCPVLNLHCQLWTVPQKRLFRPNVSHEHKWLGNMRIPAIPMLHCTAIATIPLAVSGLLQLGVLGQHLVDSILHEFLGYFLRKGNNWRSLFSHNLPKTFHNKSLLTS